LPFVIGQKPVFLRLHRHKKQRGYSRAVVGKVVKLVGWFEEVK